jgi:uncharacterized membrane protein
MPTVLKVVLSFIWLIAVIFAICGLFMNVLNLQLWLFGYLALALLILRKPKNFLNGVKVLFPFILTLFLIYLIFGLLRIESQDSNQGTILYWLAFGAKRILLIINTVIAFRILFALIDYDSVMSLPLGVRFTKYLILGRYLYITTRESYEKLSKDISYIPTEQFGRLPFSHKFRARLSVVLAMLLNVINESRVKGRLIDNRIVACHNGKIHQTGEWYLNLGFIILVTVTTVIIPIPIPGGGFFNFGDVMIVFIGLYSGRKAGMLAGGIGSAIADLMIFPMFAPITLIVKGCEGYICGLAHQKNDFLQLMLPLIGCSVMVAGYFLGEWMMPQLGFAVAMSDFLANSVQATAGFIGGRILFEAATYLEM